MKKINHGAHREGAENHREKSQTSVYPMAERRSLSAVEVSRSQRDRPTKITDYLFQPLPSTWDKINVDGISDNQTLLLSMSFFQLSILMSIKCCCCKNDLSILLCV